MSVTRIAVSTLFLFLCGCSKLPPGEFVGAWEIDTDKTCDAIRSSDLPGDRKSKLLNYYMHTLKDAVMIISADGYAWIESSDGTHVGTRQKMKILGIKDGSILVELPDSGVRELDKEYKPDTIRSTVSNDRLGCVFKPRNEESP